MPCTLAEAKIIEKITKYLKDHVLIGSDFVDSAKENVLVVAWNAQEAAGEWVYLQEVSQKSLHWGH